MWKKAIETFKNHQKEHSSNKEFLTMDHKFSDGAIHRKRIGGSSMTYFDIKRMGFPKDRLRILCFNCNFSNVHRGYCPHQTK